MSPFDEGVDFDKEVTISYIPLDEHKVEVEVKAENKLQINIKEMKIDQAYSINSTDIEEMIEKAKMYNDTKVQELITQYGDLGISGEDIKRMIFGDKIEIQQLGKRPLSKLKKDILEELGIY